MSDNGRITARVEHGVLKNRGIEVHIGETAYECQILVGDTDISSVVKHFEFIVDAEESVPTINLEIMALKVENGEKYWFCHDCQTEFTKNEEETEEELTDRFLEHIDGGCQQD